MPARDRAERAFVRLGPKLLGQGLLALDPDAGGQVHTPLDSAPEPTSVARRSFADEVIRAHLDVLVAAQRQYGGWTFNWPVWTPVVETEWCGSVTVETLAKLRDYRRREL